MNEDGQRITIQTYQEWLTGYFEAFQQFGNRSQRNAATIKLRMLSSLTKPELRECYAFYKQGGLTT